MASKRQIFVGGVPIGGGAPVVVQTMTKTETANLAATMEQIRKVADAGADLVRCAVPREQDAEALKTIVKESPIPVIADIHFNHTLALKAIDAGAHCIRLNPGNIGGREKVAEVAVKATARSEEHTSELQSRPHLVCRLLLEKKKKKKKKSKKKKKKKTKSNNNKKRKRK